jgi:hypothetical protein
MANFFGTFSNITDLEDYTVIMTNNYYVLAINNLINDNGNDWSIFIVLKIMIK